MLAAQKEQKCSIGSMSSFHAQVPGVGTPGASVQSRLMTPIQELGGPLLLPGEELDIDYEEAELGIESSPLDEEEAI